MLVEGRRRVILGRDLVSFEVQRVLDGLARGDVDLSESVHVDLKEEAGRRARGGEILPGTPRNEAAAEQLTFEAACMANSDGGGALVVGVADDRSLIGTALETEWLRARIYDLTDRRLTVDAHDVRVAGVRLLVVRSPQAIEPIRFRGRITWRVDDRCVEVDPSTWHARRMTRERYDWSEQSSQVDPREVRPQALAIARRHLRDSQEQHAIELASVSDPEMLRRLNVVTQDGYLTNAGALAFVGRELPALDYVRRTVPAGDSRRRVRVGGRSLLEEVDEVESVIDAFNEERHVRRGLVIGRLRELPPAAIREAIINGVVHRDWASAAPTVVEHVGRTVVVSSPGGFIGGVNESNIITHPSQARNRALAELFAALRVAEREGVGVDRMVRDMIAVGYPPPSIVETSGPYVRASLMGDSLDEAWIRFLSRLQPDDARGSLTVLILLRRLVDAGWFDVTTAAPLLQLNEAETAASIRSFLGVEIDGAPLAEPVAGIPSGASPAWALSAPARAALAAEDEAIGWLRSPRGREAVALDWAQHRGRISTTELGSIVGAHPSAMSRVLQRLEEAGHLRPNRATRTGRGFFYQFSETGDVDTD